MKVIVRREMTKGDQKKSQDETLLNETYSSLGPRAQMGFIFIFKVDYEATYFMIIEIEYTSRYFTE